MAENGEHCDWYGPLQLDGKAVMLIGCRIPDAIKVSKGKGDHLDLSSLEALKAVVTTAFNASIDDKSR